MAISLEKLFRSENNSGWHKVLSLQASSKPVQINPKADNIRAKSNNGYVYHRGSQLPFASQVPQYSILTVLNRNISSELGSFLILTSPESVNQNRPDENPIPLSFTVMTTWKVSHQHKSLVVRISRRPGYNSAIITSPKKCILILIHCLLKSIKSVAKL